MAEIFLGGILWGLSGGLAIGLPPVLKFGTKELQKKICPDVLNGKKVCFQVSHIFSRAHLFFHPSSHSLLRAFFSVFFFHSFFFSQIICLAVTEPWGGSDVANLHCTAKLTEDGKHYIVNGEKKVQKKKRKKKEEKPNSERKSR